jgi:hypothetical protein
MLSTSKCKGAKNSYGGLKNDKTFNLNEDKIMGQSSLQFKTSLINKAHETLRLELKTSKSINRHL